MKRRGVFALSLVSLAAISQAWIDTGHMVIAAIAQANLKPEVYAEAIKLIAYDAPEKSNSFITAACWADDIRRSRPESGPWHYMDIHFRADGKPSTNKPDEENAATAIAKFSKILSDKTQTLGARAEALRFLIHIVGDLHQPLHGTARDTEKYPKGDRGGNEFPITPPSDFGDRPPTNLHFLWDSGVGLFQHEPRPLSNLSTGRIDLQVRSLMAALPRESFRNVGDQDPTHWANESMNEARTTVYNLQEGSMPTSDYIRKGQSVAAHRATLAGYRLADLLNKLLS
jgi:hypothetical protein